MSANQNTEQAVSQLIDQGAVSLRQICIICLCLILNMLDGFDITAMAVVAKTVGEDLNMSADKVGWIFSFALAGMMFGAMVLASLSDILGRRKLVIISLLLVAVSIIATAWAETLTQFIVLRFISGMGAGAMLACVATLTAEYSPEKYKALAVGIVTAGYPMGAMMTSVVAKSIMPEYGWQGMFLFGGFLTLAMVVITFLFIPESLKFLFEKRPAGALDTANRILVKLKKNTLAQLPEITQSSVKGGGLITNMKSLLQGDFLKTTLTLWFAFFFCICTLYVLLSWTPRLVEDAGYGVQAGRDAFFWFNFGGVSGIVMMGLLSARFHLSKVITAMTIAAAVAMVLFAALELTFQSMLVLIFLVGFLQQGGYTGLYAAAAKAYPTAIRSTGIGWAIGLGRFGAVVGPAITGYMIAAGFDMSYIFYAFSIPLLFGAVLAYTLKIR